MSNLKKREVLSDKIKIALDKAIKNVIAETKSKNSFLVVADKDGNIIKIPAKDYRATNEHKSFFTLGFVWEMLYKKLSSLMYGHISNSFI